MSESIHKTRSWHQQKRSLINKLATWGIGLGGLGVIFAILLIFFYLLWVVMPIFEPAEVKPLQQFELHDYSAGKQPDVYLSVDESGQMGLRISKEGSIQFFEMSDGRPVLSENLDLPEYSSILQVVELGGADNILALAMDNSWVMFVGIRYRVTFEGDQRKLIPELSFPFGEEAIELPNINSLVKFAAARDDDQLTLAALDSDGQLLLQQYEVEDGDELAEPEAESLLDVSINARYLLLDPSGKWLYLADQQGQLLFYDVSDLEDVQQIDQMLLVKPEHKLVQLKMLLGGISLIAIDDQGQVRQWSRQRDDKNQYHMVNVRGFDSHANIIALLPEYRRKGLVMLDQAGELIIYHTTAERLILQKTILPDVKVADISLSARADRLLIESTKGRLYTFSIKNEHPEISWHSLWEKVVYEGYTEPKYIWQSSSADNDFEPKLSLTPLAFGTLKAAFYAMLVAAPLAIMGAIYTAYFMAPRMRVWVKPSIEIMEALPTVILGFLAGLWFAPVVELHLLAIISLMLVLPAGLLLFAWIWINLPTRIRRLCPEGWQAALLAPVVVFLVWLSFALAPEIEDLLFGGDLVIWLKHELGIGYDQRNALVVGIAMGLAVIPTIFSITEDAIFSVPRHLSNGSLALGATPWQTLIRVVLLTASPGIFSAVMIGFGRAVGETMIVLMATGNTPIMDMSIFEGMRTLSANIAVELPESEVASSHYRVLFLAALVLFLVTFLFNTLAEVVRQRLRNRYGNL